MNHSDVRAKMADYLEGHLELTDRALLDAHLDACHECAADVEEMRATIGLLRTLPEPEVPGNFSANVMRRIRAGEATPTLLDRISGFFETVFSPRVLAPVSAAMLSAGFVFWGQQVGILEVGGGSAPAVEQEAAALARAQKAEGTASPAVPMPARESGVQLAGLGAASAVGSNELHSDVVAPNATMYVRIVLGSSPPPYQVDARRPATVQVPFRSEWGDGWSRDGLPGSVAVASRSTGALAESMPRDATLRRSVAPPDSGRYGIGSDAARSEPRSRDDWLAILEGNPAQFAQQLSQLTLAEQEIWIDRLARHAAEQGSLDRVVERLRSAGGNVGEVLAEDFAAVGRSAAE